MLKISVISLKDTCGKYAQTFIAHPVWLRVAKPVILPNIGLRGVHHFKAQVTQHLRNVRSEIIVMNNPSQSMAAGYAFEADYISIKGHDLQDILLRIGMPAAATRFANLWVKVNPFVDCSSPAFLAEVWGVGKSDKEELQCLYIAPADQ